MRLALALLVVGCSQHRPSDPPEIAKPAVVRKGGNVKNYVQQAAVDSVVLTPAGLVGNILTSMLAFAPDGKSWASAFAVDVRFFEGLREVRRISQMNSAAGAIGSAGGELQLALHLDDAVVPLKVTAEATRQLLAALAADGASRVTRDRDAREARRPTRCTRCEWDRRVYDHKVVATACTSPKRR